MKKHTTVDDYIADAPEDAQEKGRELRKIIKQSAPHAEERLSYGMPYYGYFGRLVYFGLFKDHVGLYVMSEAREALKDQIKPYHVGKATLHFALDKPLPAALIHKLITTQAKANAEKHGA
jgi:uncharacterized protein YdhG (YjbR/CyaY superfamily)